MVAINKSFVVLLFSLVFLIALVIGLSACGAMTSIADSNQKPSVAKFSSTKSADRLFSASVQSLSGMGQILNNDRASGTAQGKKGNWVVSATVAPASVGSTVAVTARYVPSDRFDFHSRDGLTQEFVAGVERALGDKLSPMDSDADLPQGRELIAEVQGLLTSRNYNPGPVDGVWGNRSAAALKAYQADNSLPVTGVIDEATYVKLKGAK